MDGDKVHAVEDGEGAEAWLREWQWTEKAEEAKTSMRATHWGITCRLRTVTIPSTGVGMISYFIQMFSSN